MNLYQREHDLYHHHFNKPDMPPKKMSIKIVSMTAVDWSSLEGLLCGIVDDPKEDQPTKAWAERVLSAIKEPITGNPINVPD